MESLTKNRQSAETLRAMVERAYGADQVPDQVAGGEEWFSELGRGWFNVLYLIRLRGGEQVVCKIAPPPQVELLTYERNALATELAALRLIGDNTTVPVPRIDFVDTSLELCDAGWFFMQFVDAEDLGVVRDRITPADLKAYNQLVGTATKELNEIRGTAFGPLHGPGFATWREAFTGMLEDLLRDGERRGIDVGWDYATIREAIAEHADSLDEVTEPRFVEWDLWDSNVLVRDGKIAALIDHERAFYGDPLIEAGFTAVESRAFGDPAGFLLGYGKNAFTFDELRRRRLYTLFLNLVMVIETVYRGFTDPGHDRWVRDRLTDTMSLLKVIPRVKGVAGTTPKSSPSAIEIE